ncbi:MAG: GNAT family N-acetyltransferase [Proteocatella sp.]
MKITIADSKDKSEVKSLWKYCFADSDQFVDYYFEKRYKREKNMIALDENGKIQASLQLNPYTLSVGEKEKLVHYVIGVSVQPESRGLGYSSKLLKETLNCQYRNNEDISILMPIDTDIYARYGYINTFYRYEYSVDLSCIKMRYSKYSVERIGLEAISENTKLLTALSKFYHSNIEDKFSYIKRDVQYYINKLEELKVDGGELFTVYEKDKLKGYMMLLPKYNQTEALVVEIMFDDKPAFDAMMRVLKSHITQFKTVTMVVPQHELFNLLINYDNKYKITCKNFMMTRVINARNILHETLKRSTVHKTRKYNIEITDNVIPDNNILEEFNHESDFQKELPYLNLDISDLASLYMKTTNIELLYKSKRIEFRRIEDKEFFEKLFDTELKQNYINDFI